MTDEMLTVLYEDGSPQGTAPRSRVHREGLLHGVMHIWVVSGTGDETRVWFQQRAHTKKDFPDYFDTAVGGHIGAGEDAREAALREMSEEIGLFAEAEGLEYLGDTREGLRLGDFYDQEIAHVYLYQTLSPAFSPGEEVDRMIWVSVDELIRKELKGADEICAHDGDGRAFMAKEGQWCRHPGEFEYIVLPALQRARERKEEAKPV